MTEQSPSLDYEGDYHLALKYGKGRFNDHTEEKSQKELLFPWGDPGMEGVEEEEAIKTHILLVRPELSDVLEAAKRKFAESHPHGATFGEVMREIEAMMYAVFLYGHAVGRAVEEISVVRLLRDGRVSSQEEIQTINLPGDKN